jgi:ribonuclease BN (tRNA processing enzyme)
VRPRLHVIGPSPAWPNPGEACSCYVVEAGGRRLLLDCGSGAYAALAAADPDPLDAIVITHLHHDHVSDLVPFGYARLYGRASSWPCPELWLPPGGRERMGTFLEALFARRQHLDKGFTVAEYDAGAALTVGEARVTFVPTSHPGPAHAIRIDAGGGSLCFSGDTAPGSDLALLARGVDVLLCEAAQGGEESSNVHLGGADAGRLATEAGARRLVLTHVEDTRREAALAAARTTYGGPIDTAVPGLRADA